MECVDILGVKVSKVSYESATEIIEGFLTDGRKHQVVTPNSEFVVLATYDREFLEILNRADLAIPDGVGLRMAAKFLNMPAVNSTTRLPARQVVKIPQLLLQGLLVGAAAIFRPSFLDVLPETVTGTDLMLKLCSLAARKDYSIFLLGGRGGVAEEAARRLKAHFANLNVVGTYEGDPKEDFSEQLRKLRESENSEKSEHQTISESENQISQKLQSSEPLGISDNPTLRSTEFSEIDFLFVAYGAPKQEKWIAKNLSQIPVKVTMGVGGAFDFIAGKRKRAPKLLRRLGLEWLWRLLQEPQRFPRIVNATIKFPLLVFLYKLHQNSFEQSK